MKAFPWLEKIDSADPNVMNPVSHGGMDLRDYFAAKVIGYWLSYPIDEQRMDKLSKCAYEVADAMMKAREQ